MKVIQRVCFGRMFGKTVFKIVFLSVNSGVVFNKLVRMASDCFLWLSGSLKCSSSQLKGHFNQLKFFKWETKIKMIENSNRLKIQNS